MSVVQRGRTLGCWQCLHSMLLLLSSITTSWWKLQLLFPFCTGRLTAFSPPHSMMLISVSFSLTSLRLLEHQLQTQRRTYDNEVESLRSELQNVKEENNRQQQLLAQNLQLPPEARIEASLQHEITRLTNENLVRCSFHTQIRGGAKLCLRNSA